ncbi:hypothetical protein RND81_02G135100 [Saponaria officinalis]|uniref:Uncharacterized protein n=1 Tax=Saponaria officinalis TaxID=3572 RepID=A0AAW1MLB1_SAPOF
MVVRNLELKMSRDRHFTRIDILDIKIQIEKKLGTQKSRIYFGLLDSFFSFKLNKSEFDKSCVAAIGRENICLHNRLIRSILKNAFHSKTPPPNGSNKVENLVNNKVSKGYQRNCIQSLCRDVFPQSPRKGRTVGFRDRKAKDRPSPLGPHGKPNVVAPNMDLGQSPTELLSLGSRPVEVNSVEDGEEVDQAAVSPGIHSWNPVTAPLGIPWNGYGNRKVFSQLSSKVHVETCLGNGELPDTGSLKRQLDQKLEKDGMKVSVDCVNLLNNGLDTFLKRLIKPSLELASSRVGTLLDFRTALELEPQVLGEDWPVQLEKVCLRESESGV